MERKEKKIMMKNGKNSTLHGSDKRASRKVARFREKHALLQTSKNLPPALWKCGDCMRDYVVYMLHGIGIDTGIHWVKLIDAGSFHFQVLGKES